MPRPEALSRAADAGSQIALIAGLYQGTLWEGLKGPDEPA